MFSNIGNRAFWSGKTVFVTGGEGFIGKHLVSFLTKLGARVFSIDKKRSLLSVASKDSSFYVSMDICDFELLEKLFSDERPEVVFHLAAQTQVQKAIQDPLSTFDSNIKGTYNLLECARVYDVEAVIVASSDKAYGESEVLPYKEQDPLLGKYPYDVSKVCTDVIARSYHTSFNLPVCVTRLSNVYGEGDLNFDRLIPSVIRSIIFDAPIRLRSNGSYSRDFLHVYDAASAYVLLAEGMSKEKILGEAFNFGAEESVVVIELVKQIKNQLGAMDAEVIIENSSSCEIPDQVLLSKKSKQVLGWYPSVSMQDGLNNAFAFYKKFFSKQEPLFEKEPTLV